MNCVTVRVKAGSELKAVRGLKNVSHEVMSLLCSDYAHICMHPKGLWDCHSVSSGVVTETADKQDIVVHDSASHGLHMQS